MAKTICINGVDCTALFAPCGYSVSYKKLRGDGGGVMLDGTTVEDVLAVKAVVTLICLPQREAELKALLASLYGADYATLYYFDPMAGAYRTISALLDGTEQRCAMKSADGSDYWLCRGLTLTER